MINKNVKEYAAALLEEAHGDLNTAIYMLSCKTAERLYFDCHVFDTISRNNATLRAIMELYAKREADKPVEIDISRKPLPHWRADERLRQLIKDMQEEEG